MYRDHQDFLNKECLVIETVGLNKPGRISFQGTTWDAYSESETIRKNQKAIIIKKKPDCQSVFIIKKK